MLRWTKSIRQPVSFSGAVGTYFYDDLKDFRMCWYNTYEVKAGGMRVPQPKSRSPMVAPRAHDVDKTEAFVSHASNGMLSVPFRT